jgi:hypothetical protein
MSRFTRLAGAILIATVLSMCAPANPVAHPTSNTRPPVTQTYTLDMRPTWQDTIIAATYAHLVAQHKAHDAFDAWTHHVWETEQNAIAARAAALPRIDIGTSEVVTTTSIEVITSTGDGVDWDCVAVAETGADYTMHGSAYSSAYGVMDQAVRENAPPDVADRILAGTATKEEQLAMAQSIARKFGLQAWARSTYERCRR